MSDTKTLEDEIRIVETRSVPVADAGNQRWRQLNEVREEANLKDWCGKKARDKIKR